jgi:hypothetical protein
MLRSEKTVPKISLALSSADACLCVVPMGGCGSEVVEDGDGSQVLE